MLVDAFPPAAPLVAAAGKSKNAYDDFRRALRKMEATRLAARV